MAARAHGPTVLDGRVRFDVWAPGLDGLSVRIGGRDLPLRRTEGGWFTAEVAGAGDGTRYALVLPDGRVRPDPATRRQPDGVHGESASTAIFSFFIRSSACRQ